MSGKNRKGVVLLSLLPALAYWYLEANYSVRIAVMGGLGLAIIEIILEKTLTGELHFIAKFNFVLILLLGGLSLLGEEGIWFKLQPFFTGTILGSIFFYKSYRGKGVMQELMESYPAEKRLPPLILNMMERHMGGFLFLYGLFMAFIALRATTDQWVFFKTAGFYIASVVFIVLEIIFIRVKMKRSQQDILTKK